MNSRRISIIVLIAVTFLMFGFIISEPQVLLATNATEGSGGSQGGAGGVQPPSNPSNYLNNLYLWLLGAVGISALFGIVTGGVLYMFSGTSLTKVENARKWIWNSIFGIVLAAVSYLLLNTINPDLVKGFDLNNLFKQSQPK